MRKQYLQEENFETMLLSLGLTFTASDLSDKVTMSENVFMILSDMENTNLKICNGVGPKIVQCACHIAVTYMYKVYKYLRVSIKINEYGDAITFNMGKLEYRHHEKMSKDILELTKVLSGLMPVEYKVTVLPKDYKG